MDSRKNERDRGGTDTHSPSATDPVSHDNPTTFFVVFGRVDRRLQPRLQLFGLVVKARGQKGGLQLQFQFGSDPFHVLSQDGTAYQVDCLHFDCLGGIRFPMSSLPKAYSQGEAR
jgi:hypothetical protein